MRSLPVLCVALLSLTACAEPMRWAWPSEEERLRAGLYEPSPPKIYAARYCYRTLAAVDCYSQPLPGAEARQVGFFDAPLEEE